MEQAANEARELATSLRIMIELVRDAYWEQIDRTDNESMDSATVVAKRLNDAIAEVDATLHSVDLAVALIEEQMARRVAGNAGSRRLFLDDIDEDSEVDDTSVISANASASEQLAALTAAVVPTPGDLEHVPPQAFRRREVKYTQARVRDGISALEEGVWYDLEQDFSYTKPVSLRIGALEFHGLPNWRSAYIRILRELERRDPERFVALADRKFGTHRRAMFTKKGGTLINPQKIGALYVETNLSATNIASATMVLTEMFGVEGPLQVQVRRTGQASSAD